MENKDVKLETQTRQIIEFRPVQLNQLGKLIQESIELEKQKRLIQERERDLIHLVLDLHNIDINKIKGYTLTEDNKLLVDL